MNKKNNNFLCSDNPVIILNGLVTDKNKISDEQIINILHNKKKLIGKRNQKEDLYSKKIKNFPIKNSNLDIDQSIKLSEDSDSNNSPKIKSPQKTNNKIKGFIKSKKYKYSFDEDISFDSENSENELEKLRNAGTKSLNKKKKYQKEEKIRNNKKKQKIISDFPIKENSNDESFEEKNNINTNQFFFNNKNESSNDLKPNLIYKNVQKSNNYDEIENNCKKYSCTYASFYTPND